MPNMYRYISNIVILNIGYANMPRFNKEQYFTNMMSDDEYDVCLKFVHIPYYIFCNVTKVFPLITVSNR